MRCAMEIRKASRTHDEGSVPGTLGSGGKGPFGPVNTTVPVLDEAIVLRPILVRVNARPNVNVRVQVKIQV